VRRMGVREVYEATNGLEALDVLSGRDEHGQPRSQKIQVIVCDINMPKMNGLEFLHEIRNRDALKEVSVIIITAESTEKTVLEAIKLGADAFVAKPYTVQTIEDKIRDVLKRKASAARNRERCGQHVH
jgi:DNA-binding response OmpR family regulator